MRIERHFIFDYLIYYWFIHNRIMFLKNTYNVRAQLRSVSFNVLEIAFVLIFYFGTKNVTLSYYNPFHI